MEVNSQKHWYVSTSCGEYYRKKSEDYVSTAREVSQPKFIAYFFCKASMAVKKIIESMDFYDLHIANNATQENIGGHNPSNRLY